MAFKLSVVLLILVIAVQMYAGKQGDVSPFAEMPGVPPQQVLLSVPPLDIPPAPVRLGTSQPALTQTPQPPVPQPPVTPAAPQPQPEAPDVARAAAPAQPAIELPDLTLAPRTDTSPDTPTKLARVTATRVNLRAGPSTDTDVLGQANRGDDVEWISQPEPGWALIRHPNIDQEVYMSSEFLERLPQ